MLQPAGGAIHSSCRSSSKNRENVELFHDLGFDDRASCTMCNKNELKVGSESEKVKRKRKDEKEVGKEKTKGSC